MLAHGVLRYALIVILYSTIEASMLPVCNCSNLLLSFELRGSTGQGGTMCSPGAVLTVVLETLQARLVCLVLCWWY